MVMLLEQINWALELITQFIRHGNLLRVGIQQEALVFSRHGISVGTEIQCAFQQTLGFSWHGFPAEGIIVLSKHGNSAEAWMFRRHGNSVDHMGFQWAWKFSGQLGHSRHGNSVVYMGIQ